MMLISLLLSFWLSIIPASSFMCDNEILQAKIINNENGDFAMIEDLEKIDAGAFVVLDWKVNLMLPRTFIQKEISFSDKRWKWIYSDNNKVELLEKKPNGEIVEHKCTYQEKIS